MPQWHVYQCTLSYNLEVKNEHQTSIRFPQSTVACFSVLILLLPASLSHEKKSFPSSKRAYLISPDITEFYDYDGAKVLFSADSSPTRPGANEISRWRRHSRDAHVTVSLNN